MGGKQVCDLRLGSTGEEMSVSSWQVPLTFRRDSVRASFFCLGKYPSALLLGEEKEKHSTPWLQEQIPTHFPAPEIFLYRLARAWRLGKGRIKVNRDILVALFSWTLFIIWSTFYTPWPTTPLHKYFHFACFPCLVTLPFFFSCTSSWPTQVFTEHLRLGDLGGLCFALQRIIHEGSSWALQFSCFILPNKLNGSWNCILSVCILIVFSHKLCR